MTDEHGDYCACAVHPASRIGAINRPVKRGCAVSKCPCGQEGINLQLGRYLHTSSLEASGTLHQVTKDGWIGTYTYTPTSPQERAQWSLSK